MNTEGFFAILKDGEWHGLYEIAEAVKTNTDKLIEFSQVLSEHGIIKYEKKAHKIRMEPEWTRLLPIESDHVN